MLELDNFILLTKIKSGMGTQGDFTRNALHVTSKGQI